MDTNIDISQIQLIDNLEFVARHVVEGFITGLHKSPYHGFSVEFAEHRIYNTGESTKYIDWKLFARTDKLFVKRFEEETNLRSYILLDSSSSMLFPVNEKNQLNKLSYSVYCAAALIYLLRKQRDAVGLTIFSDKIEVSTEAKISTMHAKYLFAEMEKLMHRNEENFNTRTNAANLIHQMADNIHKRSLVIIFSDMLEMDKPEELYSALRHLRYNKHEVILFHVVDKQKEIQFNYSVRPYKFVDLETGEEIKVNPNDIRDTYVKSTNEFFNQLKLKCGQYNIDVVEVDINNDFRDVLLPYLIKRSKLH